MTGTQVKLQTKNSRKAYFKNVKQVANYRGTAVYVDKYLGSFSCMRVYHSKEFEESSTVLKSLGKFSLNLSVKRFQVFFFIEGSVLFYF